MSEIFMIRDLNQLEAVSLPIRAEITECVARFGLCSVREIAEFTQQNRPAIHFHVKRLMEVGILSEAGTRGTGRQAERLYKAPGSCFAVVYDADDPQNVHFTVRYAKNVFARAQRLLKDAFEARTGQTRGSLRDTGVVQLSAWLSDDELRDVNRVIGLLSDRMKPSRPCKGKRLINLTLGIAPIKPEQIGRGS